MPICSDMKASGVSVIVCTFNGASRIEKALSHICQQDLIANLELIVIDNASSDKSSEVSQNYLALHCPFDWRVETEVKPGLINARLAGMRLAKYDFLLYCDDDNYLNTDYVIRGYNLMVENDRIGALGGYGTAVFEGQKPDWFDRYSHSFAVGAQANQDGKIEAKRAEIYGAGSFWRRAIISGAYERGYSTALTGRTGDKLTSGEDVEWCLLVQLMGYEIWYSSHLKFEHLMPASRMNWKYYLKLKSGIAASTTKLFPYAIIMDFGFVSSTTFRKKYFDRLLRLIGSYWKFNVKTLVNRKEDTSGNSQDLSRVQLTSRLSSAFNDYKVSYNQFVKLSKFLNS